MMRVGAEAAAPLLLGILSDTLGGGGRAGMQYAFLVMLVPLFAAGGLAFVAVRTYPRDAHAASAGAGPRLRAGAGN
jgi:hypothetical protein